MFFFYLMLLCDAIAVRTCAAFLTRITFTLCLQHGCFQVNNALLVCNLVPIFEHFQLFGRLLLAIYFYVSNLTIRTIVNKTNS